MSVPFAEVIGDPIAHSKSPLIHRFWLEKLGRTGEYRGTRVRKEELADYLQARRNDPDWRGCNVTLPHKRPALLEMARLSPEAERIGAVNLVTREETGLIGHNSDGQGFLEPLQTVLAQSHLFRMARIFGAGGAARAVAHALADHGFTLVVASRDPAAADALLAGIGREHHAVSLSHFAEPTDFAFDDRQGILDLVVNATPLGMAGSPPLPLHWSHVPPGAIVYDLVYTPLETALLRAARQQGHRTVDGLAMLIGQAAVAFELFFGQPAPRQYDGELRALLTA